MPKFLRKICTIVLAISALWATFALGVRSAEASVDLAVSVADLSRAASAVVIAVPIERRSEWQSKRIVTFTRMRVSRVIEGRIDGADVLVRTLGGSVGRIAQRVDGEPEFELGKASLVFLRQLPDGMLSVAARSQGQFDIDADASGTLTVYRSRALSQLVHRPTRTFPTPALSAVNVFHRMSLDTVEAAIRTAWRNAHAH